MGDCSLFLIGLTGANSSIVAPVFLFSLSLFVWFDCFQLDLFRLCAVRVLLCFHFANKIIRQCDEFVEDVRSAGGGSFLFVALAAALPR